MNNTELIGIIEAHRKDSLGADSSDLSSERADALDHYHGRPYGNEVTGRSQIVSKDLAEVVDWALPAVIRPFIQSGELAMFDPVGPEDEQLAEQESDYTNLAIMKDNPGFLIVHDLAKEAMLLKNCYVKHYWHESKKVRECEYSGIPMPQVVQMFQDYQAKGMEYEIVEQEVQTVDIGGMPMDMVDMTIRTTEKIGRLCVEAVPCEEIKVSKQCRGSLQDSPYVEHETKKTRTELIQMGMDADFVYSLPAYGEEDENSSEVEARNSFSNETDRLLSGFDDRAMEEVRYREVYIRVDWDGDGVAELRKVVIVGDQIPDGDDWNEPIDAVAITGGQIKRMPHRHIGESFDDEIADLQELQTALKRQLNDNIYGVNAHQWLVNERVNLPDFLTSLPGGVKRVRGDGPVGDSVMPVMTQPIIDKILPVIDFYNKEKATRVGVRPGSDMDPDMLQEVTKGAFLEHLNRASQKIEMITRIFGETVIKELVLQCHAILRKHQDVPRLVKMRGKWTPVDPSKWAERTDLTVRVGLGTGNEEEKRQKITMLAQFQGQLMQAAMADPPPVYAKMYATFEELCKVLGFQLADKFAIDPGGPEYAKLQQMKQSQPNPEMAKVQGQLQLEQMKAQSGLQIEAQRNQAQMQAKQAEMQVQATNDMRDAEREERRMQAEHQRELLRIQAEERAAEREMEFRRWQAELDAAVKLQQASISAQASNAATQAAEREVVSEVQQTGPDNTAVLATALNGLNEALTQLRAPRRIIRGPDGKAEGIA